MRYVAKTGAPWRWMPNDLPPQEAVYRQAQRWLAAGCFEQLADDLRALLRLAFGRNPEPRAAIRDSRTLRATPESGERAGHDGAKRKKGSKVHLAVETLGHLLALHVTPADADDRGRVGSPLSSPRSVRTTPSFTPMAYLARPPIGTSWVRSWPSLDDVTGHDETMLGIDGDLNVVADDARAAPARRHRARVQVGR